MTDILSLLQEFHREKLAALMRHQAAARLIGQYDANNTYQYIVNREEVQLSWIAKAIEEIGGTFGEAPVVSRAAPGKGADVARAVILEDAADAQAFVDRWRARLDAMANARLRQMLNVVVGETLEQKRFFEQAAAGRTDLLGRRGATLGPSHGEVLPTRWLE